MSEKEFPSLPPPPAKPQPKPQPKKKPKEDKIDFLKKPDEVKKQNEKPVSYKETEENPFQMKAQKAQHKNKNKNGHPPKKVNNDFPELGGGSSTTGSILGDTNKKDELEQKYGIVINKNKKKGGRR